MPLTDAQNRMIDEARHKTSVAIMEMAGANASLNKIRQDYDSSPEQVMHAARRFRDAEKEVKEAVDSEAQLYEMLGPYLVEKGHETAGQGIRPG